MLSNIRLASYQPKGKEKQTVKPQNFAILSLVVICTTLLAFAWLTRDSLCELHIKQGYVEVAAIMAYESKR